MEEKYKKHAEKLSNASVFFIEELTHVSVKARIPVIIAMLDTLATVTGEDLDEMMSELMSFHEFMNVFEEREKTNGGKH